MFREIREFYGSRILLEKQEAARKQAHKLRIQKIKNRKPGSSLTLDNSAPDGKISKRAQKEKAYEQTFIDQQNAILLKNIGMILTAPTVQTDMSAHYETMHSILAHKHSREEFENRMHKKRIRKFEHKLKNFTSYYNSKDWEQDYKKSLKNQRFIRQVQYKRPKDFVDPLLDPEMIKIKRPFGTFDEPDPALFKRPILRGGGSCEGQQSAAATSTSHIGRLRQIRVNNNNNISNISPSAEVGEVGPTSSRNSRSRSPFKRDKDDSFLGQSEKDDAYDEDYEDEEKYDEDFVDDSKPPVDSDVPNTDEETESRFVLGNPDHDNDTQDEQGPNTNEETGYRREALASAVSYNRDELGDTEDMIELLTIRRRLRIASVVTGIGARVAGVAAGANSDEVSGGAGWASPSICDNAGSVKYKLPNGPRTRGGDIEDADMELSCWLVDYSYLVIAAISCDGKTFFETEAEVPLVDLAAIRGLEFEYNTNAEKKEASFQRQANNQPVRAISNVSNLVNIKEVTNEDEDDYDPYENDQNTFDGEDGLGLDGGDPGEHRLDPASVMRHLDELERFAREILETVDLIFENDVPRLLLHMSTSSAAGAAAVSYALMNKLTAAAATPSVSLQARSASPKTPFSPKRGSKMILSLENDLGWIPVEIPSAEEEKTINEILLETAEHVIERAPIRVTYSAPASHFPKKNDSSSLLKSEEVSAKIVFSGTEDVVDIKITFVADSVVRKSLLLGSKESAGAGLRLRPAAMKVHSKSRLPALSVSPRPSQNASGDHASRWSITGPGIPAPPVVDPRFQQRRENSKLDEPDVQLAPRSRASVIDVKTSSGKSYTTPKATSASHISAVSLSMQVTSSEKVKSYTSSSTISKNITNAAAAAGSGSRISPRRDELMTISPRKSDEPAISVGETVSLTVAIPSILLLERTLMNDYLDHLVKTIVVEHQSATGQNIVVIEH